MSELTKITVLGSARRVTLVVPGDEPLGAHLAEIARLLEQPSARAALLTPYGEQLDLALAPTDQGVLDGAVLRLVDVEKLPAPPEVTDVTDRVAELRDTAAGTWGSRHAVVGAAAGAGALALVGSLTLSALAGGWAAAMLLVVATLASTAAGLLARPAAAALFLGVALGSTYPVAAWLVGVVVPAGGVPGEAPVTTALALVLPFTIGLVWLVIGVAVGAGRRSAAAALGAAVGILLTLAAALLPLLGVGLLPTAGVVATIGVLALGLLPSLALATSGLAALDDEVIAGNLPARERVAASLRDAFLASDAAVVAVAAWLLPTVALLLGSGELWSMLLGGTVTLVALLRTRVLPTAVASWALWIAGVTGALLGILASPAIPAVVRLVVVAAGIAAFAALALARPTAQGRIRVRRLGDVIESLAAVAIAPFLLGSFGVYGFLLGVFA